MAMESGSIRCVLIPRDWTPYGPVDLRPEVRRHTTYKQTQHGVLDAWLFFHKDSLMMMILCIL